MGAHLVGAGVYDAREASRLLATPVESILRRAAPYRSGLPAIVAPSGGRVFSFLGLVGLAVVAELRNRGVTEVDVRHGIAYLRATADQAEPFARRDIVERLATSGAALLVEADDGWSDIGKGGQGAFDQIVRLYLHRISYGDSGLASVWRPAPLVLLDPGIQAGMPCIEGTRVPTATVASMSLVDSPEVVAGELELTLEQTRAAIDFEAELLAGRSIAA